MIQIITHTHFGSSSIEPSNLSGQFIVDLVKYVFKIYNFEDPKQESLIFYGINNISNLNDVTKGLQNVNTNTNSK